MGISLRLSLFLAATVGLGVAGCASHAPGSPDGGSHASGMDSVSPAFLLSNPESRRIIADLRTAKAAHDVRLYRSFRDELVAHVGKAAVDAADANYLQTLSNLRAAVTYHDTKARAEFSAELRALCAEDALTQAIEFCAADIGSIGG